jgi:hypothetical protein
MSKKIEQRIQRIEDNLNVAKERPPVEIVIFADVLPFDNVVNGVKCVLYKNICKEKCQTDNQSQSGFTTQALFHRRSSRFSLRFQKSKNLFFS